MIFVLTEFTHFSFGVESLQYHKGIQLRLTKTLAIKRSRAHKIIPEY